jgi:hypothetical protein
MNSTRHRIISFIVILSFLTALTVVPHILATEIEEDTYERVAGTGLFDLKSLSAPASIYTAQTQTSPLSVEITYPIEEVYTEDCNEAKVGGTISRALKEGEEHIWVALGLPGQWYPQGNGPIVPSGLDWETIVYIAGPPMGTKIEVAALIVNDTLNSKLKDYIQDQGKRYEPYENNSEIEENIKDSVTVVFKGHKLPNKLLTNFEDYYVYIGFDTKNMTAKKTTETSYSEPYSMNITYTKLPCEESWNQSFGFELPISLRDISTYSAISMRVYGSCSISACIDTGDSEGCVYLGTRTSTKPDTWKPLVWDLHAHDVNLSNATCMTFLLEDEIGVTRTFFLDDIELTSRDIPWSGLLANFEDNYVNFYTDEEPRMISQKTSERSYSAPYSMNITYTKLPYEEGWQGFGFGFPNSLNLINYSAISIRVNGTCSISALLSTSIPDQPYVYLGLRSSTKPNNTWNQLIWDLTATDVDLLNVTGITLVMDDEIGTTRTFFLDDIELTKMVIPQSGLLANFEDNSVDLGFCNSGFSTNNMTAKKTSERSYSAPYSMNISYTKLPCEEGWQDFGFDFPSSLNLSDYSAISIRVHGACSISAYLWANDTPTWIGLRTSTEPDIWNQLIWDLTASDVNLSNVTCIALVMDDEIGTTRTFFVDDIELAAKVTQPPKILAHAPASPVCDLEGSKRTFNLTLDQIANVSWQINGTEIFSQTEVTESAYTNTSAAVGTWNVSAVVSNPNGATMQTWDWFVTMPVFGVELSASADALSTAPSENATYLLTISNTGTVADTYTVSAENPDNADVAALSTYYITNLAAGASTTVLVNVTDAMAGSYIVNVKATSEGDTTKSATINTTTTVEDTTPPASIINLKNTTYASTYINWTWNDPADADLSHVMVYLNSCFQINVSKGSQFYNATELTLDTAYTIGTRTVDRNGNINRTLVNHTTRTAPLLDTKPPVIIHSPRIRAIESSPISISATITDDTEVASATLFFRITSEEKWTSTSMTPIGNSYSAIIPASYVTTACVEYYIEAVGGVSNAAYMPATAPNAPYSIAVIGRSIVTISVTPRIINLSEIITLSGNIIPAHSAPVTLTFTSPTGTVHELTPNSAISGVYKFDFSPDEEGIWLVNATWAGDFDTAGNISDTVSFTVNRGPAYYALIIAGGIANPTQPYFDLTANNIYKKLLTRGFTHKRIFYINPNMEQDADGDGIYDVDRISSLTNISYAINTWAQGNVSATDSLLLYMENHGDNNTFFVNGFDNTLTATDLNNHLDNFTDATGCYDIVVVYDACSSGSFINELSRAGRIIITSTNINVRAIFDKTGGLFSYFFFNSISAGKTIKEAFEDASNSPDIKQYKPYNMTPLLDDNADGMGHAIPLSDTGDGSLAASKYIGILYGAPISPPTITDVIPSQKVVANTTITIWTVVDDDSSIKDVYASFFEPNFNLSSTNDTLINLTILYLEDPDGDGNYTASFTPTELGDYTLILHATDDGGYMASPKQCIITAVLPPESAICDIGEATRFGMKNSMQGIYGGEWTLA